jgi:branched-chain amino acid transport system permease protein
VFAGLALTLNRTRIGLLIRAGVENGEMVEALGYRIRRLFVGVFVVGSALAGLGGAMWGLYQETVTAAIGAQVDRAGVHRHHHRRAGLGRRLLRRRAAGRLTANYIGFLAPKVALGSNILLMALILLWRPQGLYPVAKR